jgi:hypothetical protein
MTRRPVRRPTRRPSTVRREKLPPKLDPNLPPRAARPQPVPSRVVGRIVDEGDRTLLDVVDNLLNNGVMLNADLTLALANVDLVYIRLSALLCAADRLRPGRSR